MCSECFIGGFQAHGERVGVSADAVSARAERATPSTRGQSRVLQPEPGTPGSGSHSAICGLCAQGRCEHHEVERLRKQAEDIAHDLVLSQAEVERLRAELARQRLAKEANIERADVGWAEVERLRAFIAALPPDVIEQAAIDGHAFEKVQPPKLRVKDVLDSYEH